MIRFIYGFVFFVLFCVLIAGGLYAYGMSLYKGDGPLAQQKVILIPKGTGLNMIAQKLEKDQIIDNKWIFIAAATLQGKESSLKAGEYEIKAKSSTEDVLALLSEGKILLRQYTIPEGFTTAQVIKLLNARENLTGRITKIPVEGTLMPETYRYQFQDSRQAQLQHMQTAMKATLTQLWDARQTNLPLKNMTEALILASIVEKETGISGERRKVAGVFINRLKIGMPLQSDPTVIYAMTKGKEPLGRPLYRSDLKIDSPYNSYRYKGLPPTPICNPGRLAIEAVLNPENHNYYYFVADGTGGHAFATSLDGHNRNVQKWRKIRDAK